MVQPKPVTIAYAAGQLKPLSCSSPSDDSDDGALVVEQTRWYTVSVAYPLPALAEGERAECQCCTPKGREHGDRRRVQVLELREQTLRRFRDGAHGITGT